MVGSGSVPLQKGLTGEVAVAQGFNWAFPAQLPPSTLRHQGYTFDEILDSLLFPTMCHHLSTWSSFI